MAPGSKKPIKKVSDKRALELKTYSKTRLQFLSQYFTCERCKGPADEIHHKAVRNGSRLNDVTDFMAVCRKCHSYIHSNPAESRAKSWLK